MKMPHAPSGMISMFNAFFLDKYNVLPTKRPRPDDLCTDFEKKGNKIISNHSEGRDGGDAELNDTFDLILVKLCSRNGIRPSLRGIPGDLLKNFMHFSEERIRCENSRSKKTVENQN
jgi:hypothetical protein